MPKLLPESQTNHIKIRVENGGSMKIADEIENLGHLLTIDELARLIRLSPKTLYAKAKAGTIPVTRLSGSLRFDPKLTADWLREQTAAA